MYLSTGNVQISVSSRMPQVRMTLRLGLDFNTALWQEARLLIEDGKFIFSYVFIITS